MLDLIKAELENKKVLLLGFGREGQSTYRLIRRLLPGIHLTIADADESVCQHEILAGDPFTGFHVGPDYLQSLDSYDLIIKSPGISLKDHKDHLRDEKITSQTDLFLRFYSRQVIGITGTKGKSTTSTLVHHLLRLDEKNTVLLGNIGRPALDFVDEIREETMIVYELSSHQLEYIHRAPHISVLLNLYQEHLDAYLSYADYQMAKLNILKYQKSGDYFIYNADDLKVKNRIEMMNPGRNYLPFSMVNTLTDGCYYRDGQVVSARAGIPEIITGLNLKRKLKGDHNLMNIMAAVNVCKILGMENDLILEGIASFRGLEHRLEYIGRYQGIDFYNDSIATIPEACIEAVKALGNVDTLILGGFDRGVDYSLLAGFLSTSCVRNLILTGMAGRRILHEMREVKKTEQTLFLISRFDELAGIVTKVTRPGFVCLLSPAAASYDEFMNFEERGKHFKEMVRSLGTNENKNYEL